MMMTPAAWPASFADLERVAAAPIQRAADIRPPAGGTMVVAAAERHAAPPAALGPDLLNCLGANRDILFGIPFETPDLTLLRLQDAMVVGGHHHVITRDRHLLEESLYLSSTGEAFQRIQAARLLPMVESAGPLLLAANAGHVNHYHWLVQCLPSLTFLRFAKEETLPIPVLPNLSDLQAQTLRLAGIDIGDCLTLGDRLVRTRALLYPSLLSGHTAFAPWRGIADFGQALLARLPPLRPADPTFTPPKRLYLGRFDTRQRILLNEEALAMALQQIGFVIVTLGTLAFDEQVRLVAAADIIVAPHGAALTNMIFAKRGCQIIELLQEGYVNPCFFRLSQACGHHYAGELFACADSDGNIHARAWSVDISAVLAMTEQAIRQWEAGGLPDDAAIT